MCLNPSLIKEAELAKEAEKKRIDEERKKKAADKKEAERKAKEEEEAKAVRSVSPRHDVRKQSAPAVLALERSVQEREDRERSERQEQDKIERQRQLGGSVFDRLALREKEEKEELEKEKKEKEKKDQDEQKSATICHDCKNENKLGYKFCDTCGAKSKHPVIESIDPEEVRRMSFS